MMTNERVDDDDDDDDKDDDDDDATTTTTKWLRGREMKMTMLM